MMAPFWGRPCISCIILFPASSKSPKVKKNYLMNEWLNEYDGLYEGPLDLLFFWYYPRSIFVNSHSLCWVSLLGTGFSLCRNESPAIQVSLNSCFLAISSSDAFSTGIPRDFRLAVVKGVWLTRFPFVLKGCVHRWGVVFSLVGRRCYRVFRASR